MNNFFTLNDIIKYAKQKDINNIFLFSHIRHDGDAKGSALALVEYFKQKGFNSKYIITSEDFCLLDIFEKVEVTESLDERFIAVSVDTSTKIGNENKLYEKAEIIYKIDHHNGGELFGDYNYVIEKASSTCEIISSMLEEEDISKKIATYLYSGIYTDTGGFKYSVSENTFVELSKLLKCGANYSFVVNSLKYVSSSRKKIEGLVSYNHKYYANDIVGAIIRKYEHEHNALSVARAVNTLISINAKVFFCCCESKNGEVYVELRSSQKSGVDVSQFAKQYGGGGHIHASGFIVNSIDEVYDIISKLENLIK